MPESNKQDVNMPFPINGVFESRPHDQQPDRTTTDAKNVLSYDIDEDRQRGGRRLGTKKSTPPNSGGGLGTSRVQMLDVVPLPHDSPYAAGRDFYSNSTDEGVPNGTPADLTKLAVDPNQDGDTSDALGVDSPSPISGGSTQFPIEMYECSANLPAATSANWEAGKYDNDQFPFVNRLLSLIPTGDNGPLSTWNSGSPGLWHVRTVDERDGCIYPRAPFDKVTDDNDGNGLYNIMPSRFLCENKADAPLGLFGGGDGTYKPTSTSYVSSVVFPFQAEDESCFHSEVSKQWAVTGNIRTIANDAHEFGGSVAGSQGHEVYYKLFGGGFLNLTSRLIGSTDYYYGLVFRVKATVDVSQTTINADEGTELLFVGFHHEGTYGTGHQRLDTGQAKLKIGTIKNPANNEQVALVGSKTLDMQLGPDNVAEFKSWYGLELRCFDNKLEVFLDGAGPLPDANSPGDEPVTQFDLGEMLGTDAGGNDLSLTRSRSGIFFSRRRSIDPCFTSAIRKENDTYQNQYSDRVAARYENNARIRRVNADDSQEWVTGSQYTTDNFASRIISGGGGETSDGVNKDETPGHGADDSAPNVANLEWGAHPALDPAIRYHLYFRDADVGHSISYPATHADFVSDPESSGYFYEGDVEGWKRCERVSQLLHRAEFGGDWIRDWNEPFFHRLTWRTLEDQSEAGRALVAAASGEVYVSINVGDSFAKAVPNEADAIPDDNIFSSSATRVSGVEFYSNYYMTDGNKYLVLNIPDRKLSDWSVLCKGLDDNEEPTGDPLIPGGANSDQETSKCRLISKHLGRIVLAGFPSFPNNWFMSGPYSDSVSAGEGPNDWDVNAGDAISGTSTNLSEIGEPIRALFPFREDSLVFGCQNSIMLLQGDPSVEGGSSITNISRDIGIISPDAWASLLLLTWHSLMLSCCTTTTCTGCTFSCLLSRNQRQQFGITSTTNDHRRCGQWSTQRFTVLPPVSTTQTQSQAVAVSSWAGLMDM